MKSKMPFTYQFQDSHSITPVISSKGKLKSLLIADDNYGDCQEVKAKLLPELCAGILHAAEQDTTITISKRWVIQPLTGPDKVPMLKLYRKKGDGWELLLPLSKASSYVAALLYLSVHPISLHSCGLEVRTHFI